MACLSIKYHCSIIIKDESPTLLLCCDECERISVDNRLKSEPFLLWQWGIQIGPLRSDAQPMICPQFLPEFPWSCFSWQDPSRSSRRKVAAQRLLDFYQTNFHLNEGFPRVFHRLFHPFREQQLRKNNSIFWTTTSLLKGDIFSNVVICWFKYVNKHENRLYIYKYNWKDLNELFPDDSWLIL